MADSLAFLIVFVVALATSLTLTPLAILLSHRWNVVSHPGGRRHESAPMPRLGGIAIFGGFIVAILLAQLLPVPRLDPEETVRLTGLILGSVVMFAVGILDDIFDLHYIVQFIGQALAALIAIGFKIFIEMFNNPITGSTTDPWSPIVTVLLTVFWLMLMMNTVNFLDGLDGLAAGVAIIASLMLFANSAFNVEPAQTSVSLLPLALVGACVGFLLFNFYPARVYMGGSALFLGYALGSLSIIGGAKMATILLVMGLPLMDLAWQALVRVLDGRNPFVGDRGHLHFRLLDQEILTHRQIVMVYYVFCALFGVLTLVTDSRLFKFITFGVMLVLIMIGLLVVNRVRNSQT